MSYLVQPEIGAIDTTDDAIKDVVGSSDDDMIMQAVDQMICEVCMLNEHCYMGMCIANKEWQEEMRKTLFDAA